MPTVRTSDIFLWFVILFLGARVARIAVMLDRVPPASSPSCIRAADMKINFGSLKAFEAAARSLSLTRAAEELNVTQAAISHQVRQLESQLGVELFRRLPRGLALTDEALNLLPIIQQAFERIENALAQAETGFAREIISVGVVGTFASCWLLPRLSRFAAAHPFIDIRISTNNNKVDVAAEGLDFAIRYGSGTWPGMESTALFGAPVTPLCNPTLASKLESPADLGGMTLLRSYFVDD
ncbi:MAG TPA: LysR family transcriptional regulator, partial [Xanthomonadaceae bacterium]|nr:LysR family transcriptional regulator [Xanthomonadaceae bacterium]